MRTHELVGKFPWIATTCAVLILTSVSPARGEDGDTYWQSLSQTSGLDGRALTLMEFGGDLIVGGEFNVAGAVILNHIGRWDGTAWHPLGAGFNFAVSCLGVYQGSLIAGGWFTESGSVPMAHVARWNGTQWEPLGEGFSSAPSCFVEWNGGLVAGGGIQCRGDNAVCTKGWNPPTPDYKYAAWWDGTTWSPLGSTDGSTGLRGVIHDLIVYQGSLYATGSFGCTNCSSDPYQRRLLARWDGSEWVPTGPRIDRVPNSVKATGEAFAVWDSLLIVGGNFRSLDSTPVDRVIAYNGQTWTPMGEGVESGVLDLEVHGDRLFAVGCLMHTGIVEWDGASWNSVDVGGICIRDLESCHGLLYRTDYGNQVVAWNGSELIDLPAPGGSYWRARPVESLATFNGRVVFTWPLGGFSYLAHTMSPSNGESWCHDHHGVVPQWDVYFSRPSTTFRGKLIASMSSWDGVTVGTIPYPPGGDPRALTSYQDKLIAGGRMYGQPSGSNLIAAWDGAGWTPFGQGLRRHPDDDNHSYFSQIGALATYRDELIAGGFFAFDSYSSGQNVAAWNGTTWIPLGEGPNGLVTCLAVYHDALFAGGFFDHVGQVEAPHIARWDGSRWSPLGAGTDGPIYNLTIYNDRLIAAGLFDHAGGLPAGSAAAWDDQGWIPLGSGVDGEILTMTVNEGELYVGGEFSRAGGKTSFHLARWVEGSRIATFSDLTAQRTQEGVLIQITVSSLPFGHQSLTVYREDPSGDRVPLTATGTEGAQSTFHDPSPVLGPMTYWIAGVASTGAVTPYTSIQIPADPGLRFALFPARPNPFSANTRIDFDTAIEGPTRVSVFDVRGRLVTELLSGSLPAGSHSITWDGRDATGNLASSGVYFCRVSSAEGFRVQRLIRSAH